MRAWLIAAATAALAGGCGDRKQAAPKPEPAPEPQTPARADEPAPATVPPHRMFASPADALRAILDDDRPKVIGFGEYHQTTGDAKVAPPIRRFSGELLEPLAAHATDLVVETWAEYGNCGEAEKTVSNNVKRDTERPPETENEIVALLRRAKQAGMEPHFLPFDCDDYRALLGDDGQVDYEKMLLLITERLQTAATELAGEDKVVALYGGSTHNDLYPYASVEDLSYADAVRERTEGRYVEVDLYVPELVAGDELLASEPWFPLLERASADRVILIERGAQSYILLMRKTPEKDREP